MLNVHHLALAILVLPIMSMIIQLKLVLHQILPVQLVNIITQEVVLAKIAQMLIVKLVIPVVFAQLATVDILGIQLM